MGGKQKRAAKYRKWLEARTLLKENQLKESKLRSQLDQDKLCYSYEGGGDADQDYQRMHPRMRQEVTRGRRKFKKARFSENSWFTRMVDYFASSMIFTVFAALVLSTMMFFLLRLSFQFFILPVSVGLLENSPAFAKLAVQTPKPVLTIIKVLAYLFGSPELSFRGIYQVIYQPEEISYRTGHYY